MTSKDEALKMAIEAMTLPNNLSFLMAITACKDALEQPSVAELNDEYLRDTYVQGLSQPAQEPIHNCPNCNSLFTKEIHSIPAPSWQGLTDAEKKGMWLDTDNISWPAFKETYLLIEQALKEKNNV